MLLDNKFPLGYMVKRYGTTLWSFYTARLIAQFISERYENFLPDMPLNIPMFLGTAISVLLSFKMSQSYDRWWEARKIWGSIVNDSVTWLFNYKCCWEVATFRLYVLLPTIR